MEWPLMNKSLLLLCAIVSLQICGSKACFQVERIALLDFKSFLGFQYPSVNPLLPSWVNDSKSDCCYWERVTCDSYSNRVIHLSLENIHGQKDFYEDCRSLMSLKFSHFLPFKQLKNLNISNLGIDLLCNQLSGEIPKQIGDLHALRSLNLSHNCLNGSIPESFYNLKAIESLDLSYNHLSGTIPLQLLELKHLSVFTVAHNNLSGKTPEEGQFGTFDESWESTSFGE